VPVKFPKRRADGSFCVEVMLRVDAKETDVVASRVNSWLDEWVESNRYWKVSHPESSDGLLDYFRDFTGPPSCFTPEPGFLCLRLEGRPETKQAWKDWLVLRLLKDLGQAFHEIRAVGKIQTCADVPHERTG
jgi:hypothetical protein